MSDSESQEDVQYKVTKEFRKNVLKWVDIDDQIRLIRSKTKELNDMKKEFEDKIIKHLTTVEEDSILIKDGKLSKNVSKTKTPLKKETIEKSLTELIGDSVKASAMAEHIVNSRQTVERVSLRRTKSRLPKQ
jgi:predicted DNA-binding protein